MGVSSAFTNIPTIVFFSAALTFVVEALTWLFVYRTASYRQALFNMEKAVKELELVTAATPAAGKGTKADKTKRKLDKTVNSSKMLMVALRVVSFNEQHNECIDVVRVGEADHPLQIKTTAIQIVTMGCAWWVISSYYKGHAVGRLPFEVPWFARSATHHNLPGEDFREVSFTFIYMLCYQAIRSNLTKLLRLGPSRKVMSLTDLNTAFAGKMQ